MDRRRKNFLARGGLASADEMLDALASGVAGDEAGVMGEIDNEPGGSGTAGVSASASGGDGVVGVRSVRPTAAASGEMEGVAVDRAGNGPGQAMGSPRVAADLTASGPTDGPGVGGYGLESAADGSVGPNVVDVEGRRGGPRVVGTELEPLFPPGLPEEVVNVGIGRGTLLEPLMGRPTTDSTMGDHPLISRVRDAVVGLSTGMSQRVSQAVDMFPIHKPLGLLDLKGSWVPWMEPLGLRSLSVPWMGQQVPLVFNVPWMGQQVPLQFTVLWMGQQVPLQFKVSWMGQQVPLGFKASWMGQWVPLGFKVPWMERMMLRVNMSWGWEMVGFMGPCLLNPNNPK